MFYSSYDDWVSAIGARLKNEDVTKLDPCELVLPFLKEAIEATAEEFDDAKRKSKRNQLLARYEFIRYESGRMGATIAALKQLNARYMELGFPNQLGDLAKMAFTNRTGAPLALTDADAVVFLDFVAEVLIWSHEAKGQGTLAQWYSKLLSEVGTHNAKNLNVGHSCVATFAANDLHLGYLNSRSLREELAGNSTNGALVKAYWLVLMLPFKMTAFGQTFAVYQLLQDEPLRELVRLQGVTGFDAMPLAVRADDDGLRFLPAAKFALPCGQSLSFQMLPANAMLRATKDIRSKMYELAQAAAERLRGKLKEDFADRAEVLEALTELEVSFFVKCLDPRDANAAENLVKELSAAANKKIKKLKAAQQYRVNTEKIYNTVSKEPKTVTRGASLVPSIFSHEQLAGKAYQDYAHKGIVRFNNTPGRVRISAEVERRFYTLAAYLTDWLAQQENKRKKSLAEKYQIGEKWLPKRTQRAIATNEISEKASLWAEKLASVHTIYSDLPDAEKLTPSSDIQRWALEGTSVPKSVLNAVAALGFVLVYSTSLELKEKFVEKVISRLQEKERVAKENE